ncbi:MAG: arsenite efflux transporter metallochaperone ArsD [Verrucomicrobiales bacterium]
MLSKHTMKTIQVYDPPMCCSTGICGTDIDPDLVNFAAMLSQLGTHGIKVERFNLGQQPMAFVENPAVKALLDKDGAEALPLIFWDGEVHLKGRYPTKEERPAWFLAALGKAEMSS